MSDSSSGQIIGGIIGAVVGYFTGGLSVAAGAGIGAALGGYIGAEDQTVTGPRRDDLKVQASAYGRPLPFAYGTVPISGNVIWLENDKIKERKETEDVGGKGGGGTTQETFSYFATFAVTLCEGPIGGVRRIWADADLIYDHSTDANASALFGGANVMVSDDDLGDGAKIVIYRGTQTQRPHGRIEADKGTAPAYRGTAYLVVEDFPLEKYGNRIPSVTAEVVNPSVSDGRPALVDVVTPPWPDLEDNSLAKGGGGFGRVDGDTVSVYVDEDSLLSGTRGIDYIHSVDGDLIEQRVHTPAVREPDRYNDAFVLQQYKGAWTLHENRLGAVSVLHIYQDIEGQRDVLLVRYIAFQESTYGDGLDVVHRWNVENDFQTSEEKVAILTPNRDKLFLFHHEEENNFTKFEVYDSNYLDPIDAGVVNGMSGIAANHSVLPIAVEDSMDRIWQTRRNNNGEIRLFERNSSGDFDLINTALVANNGANFATTYQSIFADKGVCWVFYLDQLEIWTAQSLIDTQSAPLQFIVEDLTTRAGLAASELDAAALDDEVRGYTMSRVSPVREPVGQLRKVFPFDIRQNGYTLEFVPRGGDPVATLTEAELGATEAGQDAAAIVRTERVLETQMPRRIHLAYKDADREYEAGDQYAARIATDSERVVREDLPIVLTATEAARAVDVMLRDAWANQETHHVQASWREIALQPADVVTLDTTAMQGTGRISQLDDGRPGLLKIQLAPDDAGFYDSDAAGDSGEFPDSTITPAGPTLYELMDLPVLRDQDRGGGFYLAMAGLAGWPGGQLFRSESGEIFNTRTASVVAATMGHTIGTLGDGPTTIWDRGNTLSVTLGAGSLASKSEAEVLDGANRAAISTADGWELIGFADAVLEADGSYTLSTLLRGLRGTEWATAGHGDRDRFVVLSTNGSIQRVDRMLDSIGTAYVYKAATIGQSLLTATPRDFTYRGENLKPYSPVHVRGSRNSAGDLSIEWIRRTRIGGAWRDNTGVPLSEESESYEIDVMNGSTVVRTLSSTSPSVTYTAAQQTTDFGAVQPGVTVRIYQISAEVGRGHKAEATV